MTVKATPIPGPTDKADGRQIMTGASWDQAFREVGLIPRDVMTSGGYTIRIEARRGSTTDLVILDVPMVLPADKLRAALDVVDRLEGRAGREWVVHWFDRDSPPLSHESRAGDTHTSDWAAVTCQACRKEHGHKYRPEAPVPEPEQIPFGGTVHER